MFTHTFRTLLATGLIILAALTPLRADEDVKPFVLAAKYDSGDLISIVSDTREKLVAAGFDIVGQYSPYKGVEIIVFTNALIRQTARLSKRGGYGGVLRAAVTLNGEDFELVYSNPVYWANAFRLNNNFDAASAALKKSLGYLSEFGTGEKRFSAADMRNYHYTFMMEYFDDPSILAFYDSHQEAVNAIALNLSRKVAESTEVFQLNLGKDSMNREMTLFGVGLSGKDADDCSSDEYIMGKIDRSTPRHSAHLPYELLVYGNHVEALYARFRIAISWPHLPMIASDTGATFFSIMCAPGAIERALMEIAGGEPTKSGSEEK